MRLWSGARPDVRLNDGLFAQRSEFLIDCFTFRIPDHSFDDSIMDSIFEQAIARFQAELTDEQRLEVKGCTRDDVEKTIADIQLHWGASRRLRHMNRLSKFLEAMAQLGQVVEVFLNVDSTVAMIWGPIKFLLLMAGTWLDSLDTLLETYAEIGEILPSLKQYQSLFKRYSFVTSYLESYYCDILEFHRIAFQVFTRPAWKQVFHSSWKTFKTRFGPILSSMKRHRTLLSEEKLTAVHAEIQDFRGNIEDQIAAIAKRMKNRDDEHAAHLAQKERVSRNEKINAILNKIDPPDYMADQEYAIEQWRSSDSGRWILENSRFQEWLQPIPKSILYLNGIPGAGWYLTSTRLTSTGSLPILMHVFWFTAKLSADLLSMYTALDFLVQTGRVSLHLQHAKMATFCGHYISSSCLSPIASTEKYDEAIKTGYLGFHDYALAYWYEHFIFAVRDLSALPDSDRDGVKLAATTLESIWQRQPRSVTTSDSIVSESPVNWLKGLHQDPRERYLSIPAIAEMIEKMKAGLENARALERDVKGEIGLEVFYGPTSFDCSRPWCESYFLGFTDREERDRHTQEHDNPYRCEEESCYAHSVGFSTEEKLLQHKKKNHSERSVIRFPAQPSLDSRRGELGSAAADGDLARMKTLILNGAKVNVRLKTYDGAYPLHIASERGYLEVCRYLLDSGANANAVSPPDNHTALIAASREGFSDLVDLLLKHDEIDVWYQDPHQWSALGHAISMGHLETVNVFIARLPVLGIYSHSAGPDYATALGLAIKKSEEKILQLLLQHVTDLNSSSVCGNGDPPLHYALKLGRDRIAQMISSYKRGTEGVILDQPGLDGMLPIHASIVGRCKKMSAFLLSVTTAVDEADWRGMTPLHYAAKAGDSTTLSLLLDNCVVDVAKVNSAKQCPIMLAIGKVPSTLVHRMLKRAPSRLSACDDTEATLLHYACYEGDVDTVRTLVASDDVNLNATSDWSRYFHLHYWLILDDAPKAADAIIHAMGGYQAEEARQEIVEILLDSGRLHLPDDKYHLRWLQSCVRTQNGLLLWRLIKQGLRPFSDNGHDTWKLEEIFRCLARDKVLAIGTILLDEDLAEETLQQCFKRLLDYAPATAAAILLDSTELHFSDLKSFSIKTVRHAYQGRDIELLGRLKDIGLEPARIRGVVDVDVDVLRWMNQSGIFDKESISFNPLKMKIQ
ncbi:hypothetical protein E8E14_000319 [Neopestalotiopsis sp. 37M]|nr:hypothetical protein E8E14_000319 [Neopestalotiopsis sp. 37M]